MYEFVEKRFWKYYVAMEQEKCVEIKSLSSIPSILSKYFLQAFQSNSKNGDISLWEDKIDKNPTHDKFWLFFLTESAKFSMLWLLANIIFLTVAFLVLIKELISSNSDVVNEDFNFADAIALLIQLALWISVSVGSGLFFAFLQYFSPKAIEAIFSCDPVIVWVRIGRIILSLITIEILARLSLIDFNMTNHSFGDSSVTQSTLYSFRNGLQVLVDMTQMMVLYLLPFPSKFFVAISTVLVIEQILRLQIRDIHLQDANVVWMYSMARITVIVLWIVMVLYSNVFESSARESYSFHQRRIKEAAERKGVLKLLCSDIKVPLQYILLSLDNLSNDAVMHVVFQAPDSEVGRSISPSGLVLMKEIQWLRKAILCDMTLVNWLVDDLLLVMRMKEDRFTFKCRNRVNIRSLFRDGYQSVEKMTGSREVSGDASFTSLLDVIDAAIPDSFLYTSQQCLSVLVRCFLVFAWRLHQQHQRVLASSRDGAGSPTALNSSMAPLLSATLVRNNRSSFPANFQRVGVGEIVTTHNLQVTLTWDPAIDLDSIGGTDKLFSSKAARFICSNVSKNCCGRASFDPGLCLFSIGCIWESNTVDESHGERRTDVNIVSDKEDQTPPMGVALGAARGVPRQRAEFSTCLLIEDNIFDEMIRSVLDKINHGDASSAFLNSDDISLETLKKFDLLFLSSISRCKVLRKGGYTGLIVLFSGELSYLDEHSLSLFDYKLPLPILEDSVARFSDWFLLQKNRTRVDSARRLSSTTIIPVDGISSTPNASIKTKRQTNKWKLWRNQVVNKILNVFLILIRYVIFLGVDKFQWNSFEVYYKWRLLNPTKSVAFHNTQLIYCYSFIMVLKIVLIICFIASPSSKRNVVFFELGTFIPLILYSMKEYIYKYFLIQFNIKLRDFLSIMTFVATFIFQFGYYLPHRARYREVESMQFVPVGRSLNETLNACDSDGYVVMRYILTGGSLLSRWATWTFPRLANALIFFNDYSVFFNRSAAIFSVLLPTPIFRFVMIIITQILFIRGSAFLRSEYVKRKEFYELDQLIYTKDFHIRCFYICQRDIYSALERMVASELTLLRNLSTVVVTNKVFLRCETMKKMNSYFAGRSLLRKLLAELDTHSCLSDGSIQDFGVAFHPADIVNLADFVESIIARCTMMTDLPELKIYAKVDPELAVVRINKKLFETILLDAVMLGIRAIKESIRADYRRQGELHEVLVLCSPKLEQPSSALDATSAESAAEPEAGGKAWSRVRRWIPFAAATVAPVPSRSCPPMKRFFDSRDMELVVMDSSREKHIAGGGGGGYSGRDGDADERQSFGQRVIQELFRLSNGAISLTSEEWLPRNNRFGHVLRFSLQFQFCNDTLKAAKFLKRMFPMTAPPISRNLKSTLHRFKVLVQQQRGDEQSVMNTELVNASAPRSEGARNIPSRRRMEIFSGKISTHIADVYQYKNLLMAEWDVRTHYPAAELRIDHALVAADCVLVDSSITETSSLSARDIIIQLRLMGYRNIIAFIFNDEADEKRHSRELNDVAAVDLTIIKPLTDSTAEMLKKKCDEKIIKELFLYTQY